MTPTARRGIATAASEFTAARRSYRHSRNRERTLRCPMATIDHLLGVLEACNLDGARDIDASIRAELDRLPRAVGVPLSCDVKLARNTRRLHAALLDWQELVLDALKPARRRYAAVDAIFDAEEPPRVPHRAGRGLGSRSRPRVGGDRTHATDQSS